MVGKYKTTGYQKTEEFQENARNLYGNSDQVLKRQFRTMAL